MTESKRAKGDSSPRKSVASTFREPGHIVGVVGQPDGHAVLSGYDHPEELVAREMPGGGGFLVVRRSEMAVLDKRAQIAEAVMRERGFDPANVGDIPLSVILEMRAEIKKRMDE